MDAQVITEKVSAEDWELYIKCTAAERKVADKVSMFFKPLLQNYQKNIKSKEDVQFRVIFTSLLESATKEHLLSFVVYRDYDYKDTLTKLTMGNKASKFHVEN